MIVMYDLDDNLITIFDNYKECANYFGTSVNTIKVHICKSKYGKIAKKRYKGVWYRLVKIKEDEDYEQSFR